MSGRAEQGQALEFEEPEPWLHPVDGAQLFSEIAAIFSTGVIMGGGGHAVHAVTLWIGHTFALDVFRHTPRLAILSPTRRCGKTTLLELLKALVYRPLAASNLTPAVVFRVVDRWQPCLLIDEADTFAFESADLTGVLNSGHTRATASVLRTVGKDFEPHRFSTWASVVIAKIGELPATLADRSIPIRMRRRAPEETIAAGLADDHERFGRLRMQLVRWWQDNLEAVRAATPTLPAGLSDRQADNWRPLMKIAQVIGGSWPALAANAAIALAPAEDEGTPGELLIADLKVVFEGAAALPTSEIVRRLCEFDDRPWQSHSAGGPLTPANLARLLRPFGARPRNARVSASKVQKCYLRADLADAFRRYAP